MDGYSKLLWDFACTLKSEPCYVSAGGKLVQRVLNVWRHELKYGVYGTWHSSHVGGSLTCNNNDVIIPEYKIVLRFRHEPFKGRIRKGELLTLMEEILSDRCYRLGITLGTVEINPLSSCLSFMFTNGIKVSVKVIVTMAGNDDVDDYEENYEDFMRGQGAFTGTLVRFVKLWYGAKSSFFELGEENWKVLELITVAAGMEEEKKYICDFMTAFNRVIEMTSEIDTIRLAFQRERKEEWDISSLEDLKMRLRRECTAKWTKMPEEENSGCYLLDPVTGQDLLDDEMMHKKIFDRYKRFAKGAKHGLRSLQAHTFTVNLHGRKVLEFEKFFEPLVSRNQSKDGFAKDYRVELKSTYTYGKLANVIIKNPDLMVDDEYVREFVPKIKYYLMILVASIMRDMLKEDELKQYMERGINKFMREFLGYESSDGMEEEEWDVCIYLPFWAGDGKVTCATVRLAW